MSNLHTALFALLILLLQACGSSSESSNSNNSVADDEENPTPASDVVPSAQLDCGSPDYPCTLAEVSNEIIELSNELSMQTLNALNAGATFSAQADRLRSVDGMLTVDHDESAIRFHLAGGRPHWVVPQRYQNNDFDEAAHSENLRSHTLAHNIHEEKNNQRGIVRPDEEEKRALVLAPYLWDFGNDDDAINANQILNDIRGYDGNVDYIFDATTGGDDGLSLTHYQNWDQYDVIHLSTHGQQICNADVCYSELSVGQNFQDVENVTGIVIVTSNGSIEVGGQAVIEPSVDADFFKFEYPFGLNNTHIVLSGCESAKGPDLLDILGSDSSVVLGWSEVVNTEFAAGALTEYYTNMKESGRVSAQVFEDLVNENKHEYIDEETGNTVTLVRSTPSNDLRIRETVTAYNPDTTGTSEQDKLTDGMEIPLVGASDDGAADKMAFRVVVEGIEEEDAAKYDLNIYVNGVKTPETWNLGSATKLGDYHYELSGQAELGFDNQATADPYKIEFKVDLPLLENGTTFQKLELVPFAPWALTISGSEYNGLYTGSYAIIGSSSSTTQLVMDTADAQFLAQESPSETVGISIKVNSPLVSFPLNTAVDVDDMRVSFSELGSDGFYDVVLQMGAGSTEPVLLVVGEQTSLLELPPMEEFIPPPLPKMVLTSVDRDVGTAEGFVTGAMSACFFDSVPHFCNTYSFTLIFTARFP